jgi:hypothetical protein
MGVIETIDYVKEKSEGVEASIVVQGDLANHRELLES